MAKLKSRREVSSLINQDRTKNSVASVAQTRVTDPLKKIQLPEKFSIN